MNEIKVEVQYFTGCPNSQKMIDRIRDAIEQISVKVNYAETLVETAEELKFRGSPTLLVNGIDFEGLPEPARPVLACRNYFNGVPSVQQIFEFIINNLGVK